MDEIEEIKKEIEILKQGLIYKETLIVECIKTIIKLETKFMSQVKEVLNELDKLI